MYGMTNAVTGPAIPKAKFLASTTQKQMVVGVFEVFLQKIVVHILGGKLGSYARNAKCFKFQHDQSARCVLGECLINFQTNLFTRYHTTFYQMTFDQLLRYVFTHGFVLLHRDVQKINFPKSKKRL